MRTPELIARITPILPRNLDQYVVYDKPKQRLTRDIEAAEISQTRLMVSTRELP